MHERLPDRSPVSGAILQFSPSEGKWALQIENGLWAVPDRLTALTLAGLAPIDVADGPQGGLHEACMGNVEIVSESGSFAPEGSRENVGALLGFYPRSHGMGPERLFLSPPANGPALLRWVHGLHPDGWLSVDAAFKAQGVERLGLRVFLPQRDGCGPKTLHVFVGDELLSKHDIRRGRPAELWCDLPDPDGAPVEVRLSIEPSEPQANSSDNRKLGCVLVEASWLEGGWVKANEMA